MNDDTDVSVTLQCQLAHVGPDVLARICGLRRKFGPGMPVHISKMDVKDAFQQVPVLLEQVPVFSHDTIRQWLLLDIRLPFGWRSSPGWWGAVAGAIQHAPCKHSTKLGSAVGGGTIYCATYRRTGT